MFHKALHLVLSVSLAAAGALVSFGAAAQQGKEPIRMKLSSFAPAGHILTPHLKDYARELSEASGGAAVVELYVGEALGKAAEHWDITLEGLADLALVAPLYTPARFPLSGFVELPFFSTSAQSSTAVVRALLAKNLINDEYKEAKPLMMFTPTPNQIYSNKKLEKLEDFKGMRVFGVGPIFTRAWSLLGAQSVAMGYPDVYLALDRKTIDAVPGSWAASTGWKWQEVAKHPVDIGITGGWMVVIPMNLKSWSKLSPEAQARWTAISEKYAARISKVYDDGDEKGKQIWGATGKEIHVVSLAEKQRLADKLLPVWQEWIAKNEAAGKPAREMYRTYVETMKKDGKPILMKMPGLYKD